jgi:hypothetical protein
MSGLVMGLVFERDIDGKFDRPQKFVLLAYADHADQNGGSIYPSIDLISKKTGYSERAIQQITRDLEQLGLLIPDGVGPNGTNRWRIPVVRTEGGAKIAPPPRDAENCTPPMSKTAPEGIAPEGIAPDPSVVVKEPSKEEEGRAKTKKLSISDALQKALSEFGVYRPVWTEIQKRIDAGWTEEDIWALIIWVKAKNGEAGRFVARLREGTKAPGQYYQAFSANEPAEDDNPDEEQPAEVILPACDQDIMRAWEIVLTQLQMDMPRATFDDRVRDTVPVRYEAGMLTVAAYDAYTRDWLESRIESTVERLLVGILNEPQVTVQFVVAESVSVETEVPA